MIPYDALTAWSVDHPWPTHEQVEQELVLSRAICAIAEHSYLRDELVFRGGTALHKLHVARALRYSEDLDYVRTTASGVGQVTGSLQDFGRELGFEVRTRVTAYPKVFWRTTVLAAFGPCRPAGMTSKLAVANLRAKLSDKAFRNDLTPLLALGAEAYDVDAAADVVITSLLEPLDLANAPKGT